MTIEDDRRWVLEQFEYLFGRPPTQAELDGHAGHLQAGMTRSAYMAINERQGTDEAVQRMFQTTLGRAPNRGEFESYVPEMKAGRLTRSRISEYLSSTSESLLRQPDTAPDPGQENAKDYLTSVLATYGLEGMDD